MSKSVLSTRICVAESLSRLNDDGCVEVIRLLQNVAEHGDFNSIVCKLFIDISTNWPMDRATKVQKIVSDILSNDKAVKQSLINAGSKSNSKMSSANTKTAKKETSLLALPIDIIGNTALYLNEKDIFKFEQCCRMINNSSYLHQCNTFKNLI